jgi:hypothetical protein
MNNILKVLLAVLAITGLIVMIMPEGDPMAKPEDTPAAIPVIAPTTLPVIAPAPEQNDVSTDEPDAEEEDYSNFGKPMMDASPLGGETAKSTNPDVQSNPAQNAPDTGVPTTGNPNAVIGFDPPSN